MKRDQLKELGLEESVINQIMDLNGADIEKAKSSSAEMQEENEALKAQNAKDNEELSNSYKELQAKYEKDTADLSTKLSQTRLNSALDGELSKAGVRNTKAIKGLLDMNEIKLDKEGNLTGLDSQIKSIKQSDSYLFNEGQKQNYQPSNGKPAETDPVQQMVNVFKGE